jgi:PAS domain
MVGILSSLTDEFLMTTLALSSKAVQTIPQRIREGFSYWQSLRQGRMMPARRDIDPFDMRTLLPNVVLLDVSYQSAHCRSTSAVASLDFRFRLVGTEVAARSAHDYTGRRLADIPHMAPGTPFWQHREEVVRCRRPLYSAPCYVGPARQIRSCHNLLLPLSEDDELVNMIFCLVTFEQTDAGFSD